MIWSLVLCILWPGLGVGLSLRSSVALVGFALTRFSYLLFHFLIYRSGNAYSYMLRSYLCTHHITDDAAVLRLLLQFLLVSMHFSYRWLSRLLATPVRHLVVVCPCMCSAFGVRHLAFGFLGDQLVVWFDSQAMLSV